MLRLPRRLIMSSALAILPLLWGCGGSGSSGSAGSPPPAVDPLTLLSGTYHSCSISGDGSEGRALWGTWVADGAGGFVAPGSLTRNLNGVIDGPLPTDGFEYTISTDRELSIYPSGGALVSFLGGVSADGSLAMTSAVQGAPDLMIMGRTEGAHDDASLLGEYHLCAFFYYGVTDDGAAFFGDASFDGAGGGSATTSSNTGGGIGAPDSGPITYSVAADGTVTGSFNLDVPFTLEGAILADGELVVLAGGAAGQAPILVVLVKASEGAPSATLSGGYFASLFIASGTAPPSWFSLVSDAHTTAPGILTLHPIAENLDGELFLPNPTPFDFDYAVLPDGGLFFDLGARGGVSPSGRVAAVSGSLEVGSPPQLWFFLR